MSREERDSSPPRNADNIHSTTNSGSDNVAQGSSQRLSIEERLATKMFLHAREICFLLAVVFTALAALHTSSPKISKPPPARPFFNRSSVVLDFYKGHLGAVFDRVTNADFSFVMYYAPWDAECQVVRHEFESVARYYHTKIFFAAINCWHPGSECRVQYNKIQSYPVFILYPLRGSGIQYRGIRSAPYMIRFLDAFINPIYRITSRKELVQLLIEYDAVMVGYFNFTGLAKSPGYKEFYKSAVRSLERDPNRELIFAAVTDVASAEMDHSITKYPSATLLMWNESLSYPQDNEWTSESLLDWISSTLHQAALWLQPPGSKSLTLAPYLRDGPVLFLFTPRNPLHEQNYNYNLIKEIGFQYYNCGANLLIDDMVTHLEHNRREAAVRHYEKSKKCVDLLNENKSANSQPITSTVSVSIQQWINDSCCAKIVMNKCLLCKRRIIIPTKEEAPVCTAESEFFGPICKETDVFNVPALGEEYEKYEYCCNGNDDSDNLNKETPKVRSKKYGTSSLTGEDDSQSASAATEAFIKDKCRKLLTGNNYHRPVFPRDLKEHPRINLTASICKVNKTLALIAIDSLHYFHFAEGLGIDVSKRQDKTAVVILDPAQESQYVMQQDLSRYSLMQFINNYTDGLLQRTLRSDSSRYFAQKFKTKVDCKPDGISAICIPELTTDTFLNTILDTEKDVVVMYHSPYCAFCSAIAYVYLTVAQYLSKMDHLIFVRVDGDNNDLPWEYSMNRYPSILFFPAKKKDDSTVFPFSLPITVPNLLNFVLANLNGDSYVEALVNICQKGAGEAPDDCVARIRWLCLDIIEDLLRDYRKFYRNVVSLSKRIVNGKRREFLLKLQHIRDIHLILGSTVNLGKDEEKVRLIRGKFKIYYKNLLSRSNIRSEVDSNEITSIDKMKAIKDAKDNILKDEL